MEKKKEKKRFCVTPPSLSFSFEKKTFLVEGDNSKWGEGGDKTGRNILCLCQEIEREGERETPTQGRRRGWEG